MVKIAIFLITALFLSACGMTPVGPEKAPTTNNAPSSKDSTTFVYAPNGREEFVFKPLSGQLQHYGYRDICFKRPTRSIIIDCLTNRLDYEKYVNMRGYYTDTEPHTDTNGYIAREAILENGDLLYMVSSSKYTTVGENIMSLAEYEKRESFKPTPVVEGGSVMIIGMSDVLTDHYMVSSQQYHSFSEEELDAIRRIAAKYPENGPAIADALTTLRVEYDSFEGRTFVTSLPYNNRKEMLSMRIVFNDNGNVYPFVHVKYKGDDWLFVKRYATSADGERWDSPSLKFERDHSGGTVWEWNNTLLTPELATMLNDMATAKTATVRFHGSKYYHDYSLTDKQKFELSQLLKIAKLIGK